MATTITESSLPIKDLQGGVYVYKTSGALEIQQELDNEGFATVTDGSIAGAESGLIELALNSRVRVFNGGASTLTLSLVRPL
jgi:hypothetical protein